MVVKRDLVIKNKKHLYYLKEIALLSLSLCQSRNQLRQIIEDQLYAVELDAD